NSNLWFLDASLYKRHYYLYWGPLPALVLLAVKTVLRIKDVIGDQYVTFASYTLILIAGAVLIRRMTRRLFPELPPSLALLATVAFAYATPTAFMLATPGIYEAAIAAAQSLLLLGLIPAFDIVWKASEKRPSPARLLLAGCCWTAAIASRVSTVLPVAAFVLLTAWMSSTRVSHRWRRAAASATWMSAPIAAGLLALLAYNKARFDAWFEIGIKYQLNVFPFVTSKAYLPLNIFSYLFRPVGMACRFPFVTALYDIGEHGFPHGVRFPPGYTTHEPQAGLFVTAPWTWLTLVALFFAGRAVVRWWRASGQAGFAGGVGAVIADQRARAAVWCVASFAALGFLMPLPFITAFGTTMRYVADFSAGMVLLGVWGGWSLVTAVRGRWPRRGVIALLVVLALATAIIGFLLGFVGYDEMFKQHNDVLYESLRRKLSFCR
ncbi:MAG TPA: hypothetical protein VLT58_01985, partial [Polyangia bacterium]|nr:hypothetical protein [Polyangia bacterium]